MKRLAKARLRMLPWVILLCPGLVRAQGVITTIAGTDWLFPGDGQKAVNAPLSGALGGPDLAFDAQGNLYLCDTGNGVVMRIGGDGVVQVIAGNGLFDTALAGEGGPAVNAALNLPSALAVDRSGTVYLVDSGSTIRKVGADGVIRVIAGQNRKGFAGDGGPAAQALFNSPYGMAIDASGTIYVVDTANYRIRKITPDGTVTTIAGTGTPGWTGDGGAAVSARLVGPTRIALDGKGNLFFVDSGGVSPYVGLVRKIDAKGVITTVAGGGTLTGDGVAATKSALVAIGLAVDPAGNIYIADQRTSSILKVDTGGIVRAIGGDGTQGFRGDNGPALKARFSITGFAALAVDGGGNVHVADPGNGRVRRIDTAGIVTTVAGNGLFHFSGNGGPATSATLYAPYGIAQDTAGNLFVSEPTFGRIRRIGKDRNGAFNNISVYAGNGVYGYSGDGGPASAASLGWPQGLAAAADGSLLVADPLVCVIRRIDKAGIITTVAGTGTCGFGGDNGLATRAQLNSPAGVALIDTAGDFAIADQLNNRIRVVLNGTIYTLAGTGSAGYSGDGGSSVNARLSGPTDLRVLYSYLYFSDSGNHAVRAIDLNSFAIGTIAGGSGKAGFSGDGGAAFGAGLNQPGGLDFDSAGNLYIADSGNRRIRRVSLDGSISTFGGGGPYRDDGVISTTALISPTGLLVDSDGDLLFTDLALGHVRAILKNLPSFSTAPDSLSLTAPAGGVSTDQTLTLSGTIPGLLWGATTDSNWLQISTSDGAVPASIHVTADATSLAPGTYKGTIAVLAVAKPFTQSIPVTLTVNAAAQPTLSLAPSSLHFSFVQGVGAADPALSRRPLVVANAGGGSLPFTVLAATSAGGAWLTAALASGTSGGTLGAFGSAAVTVAADPGKLAPGTYSGTVTVRGTGTLQTLTVAVTMTVTAVQQTIVIPQTGLAFYAAEGNTLGSVLPQFFSILNAGQGQMRWTVLAQTLSGGNWLGAFPGNGVTDAGLPLVPQVRVDIDPSGLKAGIYHGTIQVSAPEADNSPQTVSVELNILAPGTSAGPVLQPSGMIFTGGVGDASPGSQTLLIQNTSGAAVNFTASNVVRNNNVLFRISPESGTISTAQPFRLLIQPVNTGLTAGVYRGAITLSFSDGATRTLTLAMVLSGSGTGAAPLPTGRGA